MAVLASVVIGHAAHVERQGLGPSRGRQNRLGENGGRIEDAARLAGHADARTTALYDRSKKKLERSEVERAPF